MARRDVISYYYNIQEQHLRMQEMLDKYKQEVKEGKGTLERLEAVETMAGRLKENYDRVSYIMYLMQLPNRAQNKAKFNRQNKSLAEHFKDSGTEVINENEDILKEIKKLVEEKE